MEAASAVLKENGQRVDEIQARVEGFRNAEIE
jgi:hypothetical protein